MGRIRAGRQGTTFSPCGELVAYDGAGTTAIPCSPASLSGYSPCPTRAARNASAFDRVGTTAIPCVGAPSAGFQCQRPHSRNCQARSLSCYLGQPSCQSAAQRGCSGANERVSNTSQNIVSQNGYGCLSWLILYFLCLSWH